MVQLDKEFYVRGPTKAKTYVNGDLVTVLMRGGFTRVEETCCKRVAETRSSRSGRTSTRSCSSASRRSVEEETGRKVIAMMSGTNQHPDLLGEMFVLESTDILRGHGG
jgi:uncharacterized protein YbcI